MSKGQGQGACEGAWHGQGWRKRPGGSIQYLQRLRSLAGAGGEPRLTTPPAGEAQARMCGEGREGGASEARDSLASGLHQR